MAKIKMNDIVQNLMDSAIGGAAVYAGKLGLQVVNCQASNLMPGFVTQNGPAVEKALTGVLTIAALDLLPVDKKLAKYAFLAGCGVATEMIEAFVGPTLAPQLYAMGLIDAADSARGTLAGSPSGPVSMSVSGYSKLGGYSRAMGGYTSLRGMAGVASGNLLNL
jgi:hypothetical protein